MLLLQRHSEALILHTVFASFRGEPIPRIQYTPEEIKTWGVVLQELTQLYPQHACQEFQRNFPMFDFQQREVPQLEDMSRILK